MTQRGQLADLILTRHGQSEVNVDKTVARYAEARLTEVGREQVRRLAQVWADRPPVTASSPFFAARETAKLLHGQGHADLLVDAALSEFRYLDPAFADGSTREQRRARADVYWERRDPHYRDGGDAESFADLVDRIRTVLSSPTGMEGVLVTHGMVIAAAALLTRRPAAPLHELMCRFADGIRAHGVVPNCAVVRIPRRRAAD